MMNIKELIKKTDYKKDADKIAGLLAIYRINSVDELSNSLSRIGAKIAGHDIFQFVHALRQAEGTAVAEQEAEASISQTGDTESADIPALNVEPEPETPTKPKGRSSKSKED